jgi:hypothetical protein
MPWGNGFVGTRGCLAALSSAAAARPCIGPGLAGTRHRLACEAWNQRMLGQGPDQPSPALGNALARAIDIGDTHQAVTLNIVRRPKSTPIHDLNATCVARIPPKFVAILISSPTLSRCGRPKCRRTSLRRSGGGASDNRPLDAQQAWSAAGQRFG